MSNINTLMDQNNGLSSDFFYIQIKEVNPQNGKIWDDRDTGADRDIAFWKVDPSPGFYALGHLATDFREIEPEKGRAAPVTITLAPKPGYEDLLREPIGFDKIWDDAGTGGSYGGCYIWRMKCPDGYVALGDIVTSDENPSAGSVRCIKQTALNGQKEAVSLTAGANYLNLAPTGETNPKGYWDDNGSGADKDVAIWLMKSNARPARNQVYLVAGTFKASRYHDIMPADTVYALALNFPEKDILENIEMGDKKVKLKGPQLPTIEEMKASEVTQEYYVPFFAVEDPNYKSQLEQFRASPTYKIRRVTRYEAIDSYEPINTETKQYSVTIGRSTETNYNNEVGVTLGLSIEASSTVSSGALPGGEAELSITASIETSYSHSWGGATSEYEEKNYMYPQTVTGGSFGALFQAKSTYTIYRQDGTPLGSPVKVNTNQFYTDEWRPKSATPIDAASPESTSKTSISSNTITFTIEAPLGKTIILEGRLEIRDGQLTSTPTIISIPTTAAVPVGQAMTFDITSTPIIVNNKLSRSYTKEAWIKLPDGDNSQMNIISGGAELGQHAFWINSRQVRSGHNNQYEYVICEKIVSQDWEHYAVTYDADTKEMKLYRNGQMVISAPNIPPYDKGNFVQIGRFSMPTGDVNIFRGQMAEVRIWNSARTQEQIAGQMNVAIPKATAGLIARYPLA